MQSNWLNVNDYLSVPGTDVPVFYSDDHFRTADDSSRFSAENHFVDFIDKPFEQKSTDISQFDYWESSKPGLRHSGHPVQTMFAEQRFEYLSQFIPFQEVHSALDVGCGNGVASVSLKKRVNSVFGLDMSAYLLDQLPDNIIGLRGNASQLPLRDKAVDLSMAWEILHHIEDPVRVICEMRRVTRKWIVIFDPNRWNPLQMGFSLTVPEERLALRNSRAYLTWVLEQAGLNIFHYATVGCIFPNKSPLWLAKTLRKLPFRMPFLGISHLLIAKIQ